jgi:hypothetical protein
MSEPNEELCTHDWEPFWDGSLGYAATDCCRVCGDYRDTPPAATLVDTGSFFVPVPKEES